MHNLNGAPQEEKNPFIMEGAQPFETVEEAWMWFISAQQARVDGAKPNSLLGVPRPCEPSDILKILERLHRNRMLTMDHMKVLKHYGVRLMAPDPYRAKEARSYKIWREAMERLEPIFLRKGIVEPVTSLNPSAHAGWALEAGVYESCREQCHV